MKLLNPATFIGAACLGITVGHDVGGFAGGMIGAAFVVGTLWMLDMYARVVALEHSLRRTTDALMRTDIAKPGGGGEAEWAEAIRGAWDLIGDGDGDDE